MSAPRPSAPLLAGLIAAALWLACGPLFILAASNVYVTRVLSFVAVTPLPARFWSWPVGWALLALSASAFVLCAVVVLVLRLIPPSSRNVVAVWFAVIVGGAVLGWAMDSLSVLTSIDDYGWRAVAMAGVEAGTDAAYWGLIFGWVPALAVRGVLKREATGRRRPIRTPLLLAVAAVGVFALAGVLGYKAWQAEVAAENAALQNIDESTGAAPDPTAAGDPVTTAAPGTAVPDLAADACTPDRAMLLLGTSDAAVGHRVQSIHLMNFSDEPCTIEGYIDIAIADQNGHELPVEVSPGSSYMATDPGAQAVVIPAQGQAVAYLAWDANSTAGRLVARALHAAVLPGFERGSWPVELDIIEGTDIEITAWHLESTPAS